MNSEMYQVDFICMFLITSITGYDSYEYNLTTATIHQGTSPTSTISHRRANVEIDETSSSPVIIRSADTRRKAKKQRDAWTWDNWCQLQPREGKCDKKIIRFYYNLQLDRCVPFSYSGCNGNKNNFFNVTDCDNYCKGSSLMNIVESSSQPNYCYLQPDPGLCLAMIHKYYYDINVRSCNKFTYGGCGGNENKFDTMSSCMRTCDAVVRNNP